MAINLRKITQGERGTLTFTWEFPENITSPASISGAVITATMTDEENVTTTVSGVLTDTSATTCTWALSAGDSGTAGMFTVLFKAVVVGVATYTLGATLEVIANPAVTGTQNDPLVSVPTDDALWLATSASGGALGTAAYEDVIDLPFDAAGAAAAAQAASDPAGSAATAQAAAVQRANHTGTQTLSTISDAGTMAAQAITSYYAKTDYSASPTAAEPLKANGSGGLTLNSTLYARAVSEFVVGLRNSDGAQLFSFSATIAAGFANTARVAGSSGVVLGKHGTATNYLAVNSSGVVVSNNVPGVLPSALLTLTHSATTAQAVEMRLSTSTTANTLAARVGWSWADSTHATRKAELTLYASDSGGERTGVTVGADGTGATIGFYGVTATARQLLATGAGASVDDVITALQNLGLLKQS